jgi:hypothetical protein
MSKIVLVSYATKDYESYQKLLSKSALKHGADLTFEYNDSWLKKTSFYKKNKKLLSKKRGAGYWVWKPYIILDAMKKLNKGDFIIYLDSGVEVISDLKPLIDLTKKQKGILLFTNNLPNKVWTKRDCFVKMNCDSKKYWDSKQTIGGYQCYEVNYKSEEFVKKYLKYCQKSECVSDEGNILGKPNFKEFIENRHDQSVLTNLAIKNRIKLYPDPSQYGNNLKRPYSQIFNLHRGNKGKSSFSKKIYFYLPSFAKNFIHQIRKQLRSLNLIK